LVGLPPSMLRRLRAI